jgi:hypothetical protein
MKKLTLQAFKLICDRVVPAARIKSDSLLLADWSSVLEMAHYLGFEDKASQSKLSKALKDNHCQDFQIVDIEHHRWILKTLDRELKVDKYLSGFEADLAYLKSVLSEAIAHVQK